MPSESLSELSDDQVRDLMHRAAATVVVRPAAPLVAPPRPRWPVLAAAAAVAVLVLGVALLGTRGSGQVAPTLDPSPPAPRAATVPSVFGLTRTEARARLEAAGLTVRDERALTECEVDQQAVGTIPVTGELVPTDGAVVLDYNVAGRVTLDCARSIPLRAQAWDFLAWLDGRRPAPSFASPLKIDGVPQDAIATAPDTAALVKASLGDLQTAITQPDATLVTRDQPITHCRSQVSSDGPDGSYLLIGLGHYLQQQAYSTCLDGVELHYTDGKIDQVATTVSDVRMIPASPIPNPPSVDRANASAFLEFLTGRAAAPFFADQVAVQVDDGPPQELPNGRVTDVLRWFGGADLRATVAARLDETGATVTAEEVENGHAPPFCGTVAPEGTEGRVALSLTLSSSVPRDGLSALVNGVLLPTGASCRTTVDLYRDDTGAIDTVVVGTRPLSNATARPSVTVADGVPDDAAGAGLDVVVFAAYQGPTPPLAARVRLFVDDEAVGARNAHNLARLGTWRFACPPQPPDSRGPGCELSALSLVTDATDDGTALELTADPPDLPCGRSTARSLPADVTALTMVAIVPAEPTCVSAGELQLYVDGEGRIAAVNVLTSDP